MSTARVSASLHSLPHALHSFQDVVTGLEGRMPAVFLDYDGTLTPIADHPDLAELSEPVRDTLRRLARLSWTGIISGRDLDNIRGLVQVDGLIYAGSHGFDLLIPGHGRIEPHPPSPVLDRVEQELRTLLQAFPGVHLERKRHSLAVHYRQALPRDLDAVQAGVERVLALHQGLRHFGGKKVIEIQPNLEWDKGQALLYILDLLPAWKGRGAPIYIGDDTTDEHAFAVLPLPGAGICVSEEERTTRAAYRLNTPREVHLFLEKLLRWLEGNGPSG